jgi:L-asparaginase II
MLLTGEKPTQIHNNCSGKHTMMLALCKLKNWDIKTYNELTHPLQQAIKKKIYTLCEIDKEYPITKDGCGVPIFSMPLYNILKGYLNLFLDEKYSKLKNAFLNNPYVIGGEDRTDTKIIANSSNIVCKTGAGGLFVTIDTKNKDGFIVKVSDCDMKSREITVIEFLKKLNRANIKYDNKIRTLHNDIVGEIRTCF